ncbi:MAG: hypothetical protein ACXW4H_07580 [Candidatus Limnocylindrales bacterium]
MTRRIPLLLVALIVVLASPTIVAAADPTLTATVIPGQEIDVVGSGFPSDADVVLAIQRNGTDAGSQALRGDAAGGFTAVIDAGPGRGGVYTLTATSGSVSATVEAMAVETAGGLQSSTPPPTDAVGSVSHGSSDGAGAPAILILVAACSLSLVVASLRRRAAGVAAKAASR